MCRCTSIWMIGHKTRMFEVAFRMLLRHSFHFWFKFETHASTRVLTHMCSKSTDTSVLMRTRAFSRKHASLKCPFILRRKHDVFFHTVLCCHCSFAGEGSTFQAVRDACATPGLWKVFFTGHSASALRPCSRQKPTWTKQRLTQHKC